MPKAPFQVRTEYGKYDKLGCQFSIAAYRYQNP